MPINDKLLPILEKFISSKRLAHSLRVSQSAKDLAVIHNLNDSGLELSGLVHDIAKEQTPDSLKKLGINTDKFDNFWQDYMPVWHAFIAPELIKVELHYIYEDVKDIIIYHTTGAPNMTREAMALFIADFTEPDRDHPQVEEIRSIANISLEHAVARITKCSIDKLMNKSVRIHPLTFECWNYYCKYIPNS